MGPMKPRQPAKAKVPNPTTVHTVFSEDPVDR